MRNHPLSRRTFLRLAGATAAAVPSISQAPRLPQRPDPAQSFERERSTQLHEVIRLWMGSKAQYADPYNEVTVDFLVTAPDQSQMTVPGFWAGRNQWSCTFSGAQIGTYVIESRCNRAEDAELHAQKFTVTVTPYTGSNSLLRHGRLRLSQDKRRMEHSDGAPFLWIGDTWWMGLCSRLETEEFVRLADDRAAKGFSVVQIIAGPYPDMDTWDPRGMGPGGFPFEKDFAAINPAYYGSADNRIEQLIERGIVPCIVGMWGYYLPRIGVDRVKQFWRNLVARYAAYPVVWCLAGEATMPYYLSETRDQDAAAQKSGWTEAMRYVREIDPYHNPITIHPTHYGHDQIDDPALMDVDMLQTGHSDIETIPNVIKSVREAAAHEPKMPVINGEVNYEGIMGRCWQNVVRLSFYHSMLNGATGFTYGANGIWQVNRQGAPYGPSPHGRAWGNTPWDEAMNLPGSAQVGLGGKLFARFRWWELQRQSDWLDAPKNEHDAYAPVAAGIPGRLRIVYAPMCWNPPKIRAIEADANYTAWYFDPTNGNEITLGPVKPDAEGNWTPPLPPEVHDWIIVLEAK